MVQVDRRDRRPSSRDGADDGWDGNLGDRLAAGCDAVTLEDLYDAYGAACYRLAHHVVPDPHLASAVVQDVFLAVWKGHAVFDPVRGSVQSWLLGATHRNAVDLVRRNRRPSAPALGSSVATDAEAELSAGVLSTDVRAALAKLSVVHRELLQLAYFGGYTQSELADLTGTPVATIKTRTLVALRQLRANLAIVPSGADVPG